MSTTNQRIPSETPPRMLEHLAELRKRIVRSIVVLIMVFACLLPFSNRLYHYLSRPLLAQLPEGSSLIATGITSPFLVPLKFAFLVSFIICVPFYLYQIWSFVAPALYKREKQPARFILFSSIALFYLGMSFAYWVVFPLVFAFFAQAAPSGVKIMPDINVYLDFAMQLFFAFGWAFEVPVIILVLNWSGLVSISRLRSLRRYIIVAAFVIGMLLTPPDVVSQILLAVPILILYELGLVLASSFNRKHNASEEKHGRITDTT